ncbi:MAG TPA: GNAT family N-acetyltransferase [Saprospirales bacterium]|nr:GNAT family N-acetyltransferase [Saprospirales bacterium]
MEKKRLHQDGTYAIWRHTGIPEEAMTFLDSIAWGNEGAVYEHKNTEAHIRLLHRPTLLAIYESEKLEGTAMFCHTPMSVGSNTYNCYYIRYFAASKAIRGKGLMKHYAVKAMEAIRNDEQDKTIFFACVEKGNYGSYKVVQSAGYNNIGVMKTNGFRRFFPKANPHIEQVKTDSVRKEVVSLLQKQYETLALVGFNSLFLHDDYYVLRGKGEIVAGCQTHRVHWVINSMPGLMGKVIMNVVPLIPLLNQLFNPKRFEFLAFEGIFVKPGYENRLMDLFEGLLAREKLKSAMFWLGESCPIREGILKHNQLGLLHSFVKDSDAYIMASFKDFDETEIADVKSRPLFASAFDYI